MAKRNKFKVFLDIDGVLNSNTWFEKVVTGNAGEKPRLKRTEFRTDRFFPIYPHHWLDPAAIGCANDLIKQIPGAEWVISSTWRHGTSDMFADLVLYLSKCGLKGKVVDRTNTAHRASRGSQIQNYLDDHQLRSAQCLILDDNSDMLHLQPRLIQTSYRVGLQPMDVKRALQLVG